MRPISSHRSTPARCCRPPAAYVAKDNIVDLELSEYAGYSGIIVANGGLEPTENSFFFRKHGFKLRIKLSEEESWPALNAGRIAAAATTVDVLTAYCRNFQVVAPVQIGFLPRRGRSGRAQGNPADQRPEGQDVLVTAQFTESDFFIRYLAQEAGLGVHMLRSPTDRADPERLNLLFAADAFTAGDLFLKDWKADRAGSPAAYRGRRRQPRWSPPAKAPPSCSRPTRICSSSPTSWS
jgi:NitT/TauT family transport system substrate-binding protein